MTIGCRAAANGTVNLPFAGAIDEVRIYDRALSASDIAELYDNKAFSLNNNGIGYWNGLAGSAGNATVDTSSLNFCTNLYTAPLGTADNLADLLNVEQAGTLLLGCAFADAYYSSGRPVAVTSTNLAIVAGGLALGTSGGVGNDDLPKRARPLTFSAAVTRLDSRTERIRRPWRNRAAAP